MVTKPAEELKLIHKNATLNRNLIDQSDACGCFYCLEIVSPDEIDEWTDDESTAICPKCGIDSLIPSAAGIPLTDGLLKEMHHYFFIKGTTDETF